VGLIASHAAEGARLDQVQSLKLSDGEVQDHFASARYDFDRRASSSLASFSNFGVALPRSK
jgi:hypothetical protein